MAHVVGVPKRDPCMRCRLPVFLAERLTVGKKVYHRTCLKCARCGYQLTPGSFYETEIDDQYCCETCPDEESNTEILLKNESEATASSTEYTNVELRNQLKRETSPNRSVRSSIKERLAFFENRIDDEVTDSKLLQKSLSDEEKSKSLHSVEYATPSIKLNTAFTSFFNNAINDEEENINELSNSKTKMTNSEGEDTDNSAEASIPPELPKSMPPLDDQKNERNMQNTHKHFTSSTQLVLESTNESIEMLSNHERNIENQTQDIKISLLSNIRLDKTNNNSIHDEEQKTMECTKVENDADHINNVVSQLHQSELGNNVEISITHDVDYRTKDKLTDELNTENIIESAEQPSVHLEIKVIEPLQNESSLNIKSLTKDEEEVNFTISKENDTLSSLDIDTTERHNAGQGRLQHFDVITHNEESEIVVPSNNIQDDCIDNEILNQNIIEYPESGNINDVETETESSNNKKVPLTSETKDYENLENMLKDSEMHSEDSSLIDNKCNVQTSPTFIIKTTIEEYPQDLNPFKSDEENDEEVCTDFNKENVKLKTAKTTTKPEKQYDLNPFDSSDDEVELEKSRDVKISSSSMLKVPPPRPPPPRISKNPFGSEDENEDDVIHSSQRRSSLTGSQRKRQPVPTPRTNM